MILASTYTSGLLLLFFSFLCFGLCVNTFKAGGVRWRFELYSIDFALGFVVLSLAAALTLGTLGSDMSYSDRMLVAGRSSQAFMAAAGFLFGLANMLVLAAVGLLGMAGAVPIASGVALLVSCVFFFQSAGAVQLAAAVAFLVVAVVFSVAACRVRESAQRRARAAAKAEAKAAQASSAQLAASAVDSPKRVPTKPALRPAPAKPPRKKTSRSAKGIFVALFGGALLGFCAPVGGRGMTGDLSLGPYSGLLMFALGLVLSTVIFDFYFLNISIEGEAVRPTAYLAGNVRQHALGFAGGALWAAGALAALVAFAVPAQTGLTATLKIVLPLASVLLAIACGAWFWKEFKNTSALATVLLAATAVLFALGLYLFGAAANI